MYFPKLIIIRAPSFFEKKTNWGEKRIIQYMTKEKAYNEGFTLLLCSGKVQFLSRGRKSKMWGRLFLSKEGEGNAIRTKGTPMVNGSPCKVPIRARKDGVSKIGAVERS